MQMEAFNNAPPPMATLSPYTLPYTFAATKNPATYTLAGGDIGAAAATAVSCPRLLTTSFWMDPMIWCRLPQPILDRVVAFLPPPAFFRARCVCRRWYAFLYSSSFLQLYLHLRPHRRHWFLFFNHNSLKTHIYPTKNPTNQTEPQSPSCCAYLFDPYDVVWYRLNFPLIPAGFSPASSSGGLVCWVSDEAGPKSLFLHNPLLVGYNSVTQLPPTVKPRLSPSVGLAVSSDYWSGLDVVVAGDDMISPYAVKNLTTETCHVNTLGFCAWGEGPTSPLPRLCSLESRQMVYCHVQRKFYCMNYNPFGVLAYDVASGAWTKIQAPMRRFLRCPSLVESRGEVALVAAVEKSKLSVPRSLRVWRLLPCGAQWTEVERMPQQMYVEFEAVEGGSPSGFDCVGHGEFIVVTIRGESKAAVMFDGRRKQWTWMPPCPFVAGGGEMHGFAYEPRLATPVTGLLDHHFALP